MLLLPLPDRMISELEPIKHCSSRRQQLAEQHHTSRMRALESVKILLQIPQGYCLSTCSPSWVWRLSFSICWITVSCKNNEMSLFGNGEMVLHVYPVLEGACNASFGLFHKICRCLSSSHS